MTWDLTPSQGIPMAADASCSIVHLARIFHESPAATADMTVLSGVLGCSFGRLRTSSLCDVPFRHASCPIPRYRGMVARWHTHLHGLATAIHETSGLVFLFFIAMIAVKVFFDLFKGEEGIFDTVDCFLTDGSCTTKPGETRGISLSSLYGRTRIFQSA